MNLTNIIYLTVSSIAVTLIGGILYCVANKIAIIELFSKYPTPMWTIAGTLMGVVIGFLLDQLAYYIVEKRNYRARVQDTIERIKKTMHLSNSRQAIQRIADLTPQFREEEQIKILSEIGFESSLNANTDDVTHCVIEEFRWLVILYETAPQLVLQNWGQVLDREFLNLRTCKYLNIKLECSSYGNKKELVKTYISRPDPKFSRKTY